MPSRLSRWAFHRVTDKGYAYTEESGVRPEAEDDASVARFVARFGGRLRFEGRSVLDVGCGLGALCAAAARAGATRVVGIDLEMAATRERAADRFPELLDRIELVETAGKLAEVEGRRFDLVVSKDAMEHYPDPEGFVRLMAPLVAPGGELAIGFSPLWKSPYGGHIEYMTKLPWAHLLFAEETIMAERRRFRPHEQAGSFAEVVGGLNKMTLARFRALMATTGLERVFFETNVGDGPRMRAMRALARPGPLREYFTQNAYGIWRKPSER